jgi:cell division protein FtsZ
MIEDLLSHDLQARIKVVGVGGSGCNALDRMIAVGLEGVDFVALNTDFQALSRCKATIKVQIGSKLTKGLGAGSNPEIGRKALEESRQDVLEKLEGADMIFITCGMGGGTGTGSSPLVAEVARELAALTVGIVTRPFHFEGKRRSGVAAEGIDKLRDVVDTLIVIPNDRLLDLAKEQTTLLESFLMADDILRQGVTGITNLIVKPGLINLDFADVKMVMQNSGNALIGLGEASGENRAVTAVEKAIQSPLLESSIDGATGVLLNFFGDESLTLMEVNRAAELVYERVDENANIIVGAQFDGNAKDSVSVMILATGFPVKPRENARKVVAEMEKKRVVPLADDKPFKAPETTAAPVQPAAEEDLDIPAFIRRMKK